ncbi:hypothetical protein EV643_105326 [Kribbella sp. VKM Ac-2527]|uniref:Uncharacterized protein n=1 Tax=Kribbella caucasensis TaxID=2512215 RepID=A0A4R6KLS3_9ACTN|nr:hypothetical protein [Kribbella sp. VKM Ac-2527]TDO50095.1 hypothetical protein EV643_105326 [Kribbella sp. VKM Ac-2527]
MIGRRRFIGGAVVLAAGAAVAVGPGRELLTGANGSSAETAAEAGATATTPATSTTPSTGATSALAAASIATSMVKFGANTELAFATGLQQNSTGEAAPIKAEYALAAKLVTNAQWAEFAGEPPDSHLHRSFDASW